MRLFNLLLLLIVIICGVLIQPAAAAAATASEGGVISPFAIGYQSAQEGLHGISMKIKVNDSFRLQPVFWIDSFESSYAEGDLFTYSAGVRGIYDLKTKDGINRYTGLGLGYKRNAVYLYDESGKYTYVYKNSTSAQAFLGLEFSSTLWTFLLSWFGKAPPLDASLELGLGVSVEGSHIRPRTAVNFGIHYGF